MRRDAAVGLVSDDADQLRHPPDAQRGNNSELAETAADQVGEHGLLLDEDFPGAMERESRLLLDRFDRRKPHCRTTHGLADRRGIEGVALPALHIRLYIAGRHHPHLVTERGQFSRPVMRGRTGLNADQTGRQRGEEASATRAGAMFAQNHLPVFVDPVSLENVLCHIKANPGHGHGIPLRMKMPSILQPGVDGSGGRPPHFDWRAPRRTWAPEAAG